MILREWLYTIPLRVRTLFRRNRVEDELAEELRFHLEHAIEAGVERGLTANEARLAALRRLDGIEQRKEECRDTWRVRWLDGLIQDLKYTARNLRRSPGFAAVAIASLSLGIGANTAVFSLMDVLLIRPLPVLEPGRLALVSLDKTMYAFSYPLFRQVAERNAAFSGTFAWYQRTVQMPEGQDMLLIPAAYGSGSYFSTLGVAPQLGTVYGPEDDQPNGGPRGPVAVLSDGFWTRKYGRNPAALGQAITLNGVALTVIGVMPPGFFGVEVASAPDVWIPLNVSPRLGDNAACFQTPSCYFMKIMGRLRPGIAPEQADAALQVISPASLEATLTPKMRADRKATYLSRKLRAESGRSGYNSLRSRVKSPLEVLMALVVLVLAIACANMANLLTARSSARAREVGVRLAMGAGRARLIRQFLTESVVLSTAGSAGGLLFSLWSTRVLIGVLTNTSDPVHLDLSPDWRVLAFSMTAALLAGILFGVGPALRATRHGLAGAMKERAHQVRGGQGGLGLGRALLAIQVTLSVVLLAAAGLFAGTLWRLMTRNPGFQADRLTVVSIVNSRPPLKPAAAVELFGRLVGRARQIPGVDAATLMASTPLTNSGWSEVFRVPGRADLSEQERLAFINVVGTQFTKTAGIPLVAGREFADDDTAQSEKVVMISENAAKLWFPKGDAVGAQIGLEAGFDRRIVGIVRHSNYMNLREALPLTAYVPNTQSNQGGFVAIRSGLPVSEIYADFRRILRAEAPGIPIATVKTMRQQVDESLATERLTAYLAVFIGVLALLLTSVGLYGILAYLVTRRTGEIGIRMALGAQRTSVVWLVVREAMGHTIAGIAVGVGIVLASSSVVKSLLFDVQPNDPATIAAAVALLALVCGVAASLPARRASRLDPMQALRED